MNDFELAEHEVNNIIDAGDYLGKDKLMNLFFARVTKRIFKPITQDELEFFLIYNGLKTPLSFSKINVMMRTHGFRKNNVMIEGKRMPRWVNDTMKSNPISQKLRFTIFLKEFLSDKTEILFLELRKVIHENGFNPMTFDPYFFNQDGTYKKWGGWVLTGKLTEKIYKKVDSDALTEQE
jgi:hypothetical protein